MKEFGIGVLPVGEQDRLTGMLTDRDIVIRAISVGRGPETQIREVMSPEIRFCYEDESVEDVAVRMGDLQVRRLPVVNRQKRLVGIVSLGDVACGCDDPACVGETLSDVSSPPLVQ
jgi:CBS domain-containing protein